MEGLGEERGCGEGEESCLLGAPPLERGRLEVIHPRSSFDSRPTPGGIHKA